MQTICTVLEWINWKKGENNSKNLNFSKKWWIPFILHDQQGRESYHQPLVRRVMQHHRQKRRILHMKWLKSTGPKVYPSELTGPDLSSHRKCLHQPVVPSLKRVQNRITSLNRVADGGENEPESSQLTAWKENGKYTEKVLIHIFATSIITLQIRLKRIPCESRKML